MTSSMWVVSQGSPARPWGTLEVLECSTVRDEVVAGVAEQSVPTTSHVRRSPARPLHMSERLISLSFSLCGAFHILPSPDCSPTMPTTPVQAVPSPLG